MKRFQLILNLIFAGIGFGQSTIDPTNQYAYSGNGGWVSFRPSGADGAVVTESFLSGYLYAANFGWIHLGDGTPDNGYSYSNASATDYGVNMDVDGNLSGKAWGANIGWVNFEQRYGRPSLSFFTGAFSGNIYSANAGWINLNPSFSDVRTTLSCPDSDGDGMADPYEMQAFGSLSVASVGTDFDGDGQTDSEEYQAGTDPTDPGSSLKIVNRIFTFGRPNEVEVTFTSSPNRLYQITYSHDLGNTWTDSTFGIFSPGQQKTTTRLFRFPENDHFFFRVSVRKPLQ